MEYPYQQLRLRVFVVSVCPAKTPNFGRVFSSLTISRSDSSKSKYQTPKVDVIQIHLPRSGYCYCFSEPVYLPVGNECTHI